MRGTSEGRAMPDALSFHSSSDRSVLPVYLDGWTSRSPSSGGRAPFLENSLLQTARSMDTQAPPNSSSPAEWDNALGRREPIFMPEETARESGIWNSIWSRAGRAAELAVNGATQLFERLIDPQAAGGNDSTDKGLAVQVVHINESHVPENPTRAPYLSLGRAPDSSEGEEEDENEEMDPPLVEIDLSSTLRAYLKNPNECFGHLVAAALSSRSSENPVTAEELKEAQLNPFLVRMLIDSQRLKIEDQLVQEEIQRCLDNIVPSEAKRVPPVVYEYLPSLFKLHFVRLSFEQYAVLKNSGFEFVGLLCQHPHVLPPGGLNFIRLNYVQSTWYFDALIMVVNILTEAACVSSIMLTLSQWLLTDGEKSHQKIGFFTAILYGFGYAAHLISMIFLIRGKERDTVYGNMISFFPSPHLLVLPVIPFYNIVSLIMYLWHRLANRNAKYVAVLHDILVAQILSSLCFTFCVAMPQLMYQTYANSGLIKSIGVVGHRSSFALLSFTVIFTAVTSSFRFFRVIATFDSINQFGFACFGAYTERIIGPNSALPRMVCASSLFVFELNIFFGTSGVLNILECRQGIIVTVSLSSVTVLLLLIVYAFLLFGRLSVFRIMWSMLPLSALQIAFFAYHRTSSAVECRLLETFQSGELYFAHFIWGLFVFLLGLLVIQLLVSATRKLYNRFF